MTNDIVIRREDVALDVSLTFRYEAGRAWAFRVWLAQMLMRLAGIVAGMNVSVEATIGPRED